MSELFQASDDKRVFSTLVALSVAAVSFWICLVSLLLSPGTGPLIDIALSLGLSVVVFAAVTILGKIKAAICRGSDGSTHSQAPADPVD